MKLDSRYIAATITWAPVKLDPILSKSLSTLSFVVKTPIPSPDVT